MAEGILEITDANFDSTVLKSDKVALVDFWAPWCGPCRMIAPAIEQLSKDFKGRAVVGKINVDDNQKVAAQFNIMSIPAVLIFKGGRVVDQLVGARGKGDYATAIEKHLEG